jgi:hypothetical protein
LRRTSNIAATATPLAPTMMSAAQTSFIDRPNSLACIAYSEVTVAAGGWTAITRSG